MAPVFSLFTHANEQYADEQTWAQPGLPAAPDCQKSHVALPPPHWVPLSMNLNTLIIDAYFIDNPCMLRVDYSWSDVVILMLILKSEAPF